MREKSRHGPQIEAVTDGHFDQSFCRRFLAAHQNQDGGWGYFPHKPSSVEATSWALMALRRRQEDTPAGDAMERGCEWLIKAQLKDGSWPAFVGQPLGCWATSLAAMALHGEGASPEAVVRARDWLLNAWPAEGNLWWRLARLWSGRRVVRQDNSLAGWSWTRHTASWVEPTAHALLFLGGLDAKTLSSKAVKRRRMAEAMLLDRMCPGGGWNSGNPQVYGVPGVPSIGPTSWALLALAHSAHLPVIHSSVDWLERACASAQGPASLVLAYRCLKAYGRNAPSLDSDIVDLYARNRFFESTLTVAWLGLALADNPQRPDEGSSKGAPA